MDVTKIPPARQKETPGTIQRPLATIHKHLGTPATVVCSGPLHRVKAPCTTLAARVACCWQLSWVPHPSFLSPYLNCPLNMSRSSRLFGIANRSIIQCLWKGHAKYHHVSMLSHPPPPLYKLRPWGATVGIRLVQGACLGRGTRQGHLRVWALKGGWTARNTVRMSVIIPGRGAGGPSHL